MMARLWIGFWGHVHFNINRQSCQTSMIGRKSANRNVLCPFLQLFYLFIFLILRNNNSFAANNPVKALYFSHRLRLISPEKNALNWGLKTTYIYIKKQEREERDGLWGWGMILLLFLFFWGDKTVYCCIGIGLRQKNTVTVFNLILFINHIYLFLNLINWIDICWSK